MTFIQSNAAHQRRIKPLPPLLVNQLAAGEIVTRPASVVKELVENAIDAGSTHIEIKVTQGGMGMIEVRDDGFGIHPDDMIMAVTRHATSKIADVANLQGIKTLGFRGEALASMAAVSRLSLISCHDDSGIGRQLSVAGIIDDTPILTPVVHSQGTTVTVKDLYFNVPARRGNLKTIATEFAHIEAVVQGLALAVSHVDITLWHNNKKRFAFAAISPTTQADRYSASNYPVHSHQIMQRLGDMIALKPQEDCVKTLQVDLSALVNGQSFEEPHTSTDNISTVNGIQDIGVNGLLLISPITSDMDENSNSSSMSRTDQPKLIYINGRLVKDSRITQHIKEAVNQINTNDGNQKSLIANLGYVLFFTLPLTWLNVNVHPSKQRIGIQFLPNILAYLKVNLVATLLSWQQTYQPPQNNNSVSEGHIDLNVNTALKPKHSGQDNLVSESFGESSEMRSFENTGFENSTSSQFALNQMLTSTSGDSKGQVSENISSYCVHFSDIDSRQCAVNQAENVTALNHKLALVPRCVAFVSNDKDKNQSVDTLDKAKNDDNCSLPYKNFVMLQDSDGICIIELTAIIQLVQSLVNSHQLSDESLTEPTKAKLENKRIEQLAYENNSKALVIINNYLERWYVQSNNAPSEWQKFNKRHSLTHLDHQQLLSLLMP